VGQYYHTLQNWIDAALMSVVSASAEALKSQEHWRKLAGKPADFNNALDRVTGEIRIALKLLHRIPDYRPSEHAKRDKELYRLKTVHDKDWSFGELAIQYTYLHPKDPISDKQAERSYKQESERVRRKINRARKAAAISLGARGSLIQELVKHQFIFEILTTK
jgi:hypothetical protein